VVLFIHWRVAAQRRGSAGAFVFMIASGAYESCFAGRSQKDNGATYRSLLRTGLLARSALQWLPPRALIS
jgi:hypothetical protein